MASGSTSKRPGSERTATESRGHILDAAFAAFTKCGYAATSTLAIATAARVSKRELYSLFGSKEEMLIACISDRARRLQPPADLPPAQDRETLAQALTRFGAQLLREITAPAVVAMFRLAIAEAIHAPQVSRSLDAIGREATRVALRNIMSQARDSALLTGRPSELTEQFSALLWGNLMVGLLLGVAERPSRREIDARARNATDAFLRLHPK